MLDIVKFGSEWFVIRIDFKGNLTRIANVTIPMAMIISNAIEEHQNTECISDCSKKLTLSDCTPKCLKMLIRSEENREKKVSTNE